MNNHSLSHITHPYIHPFSTSLSLLCRLQSFILMGQINCQCRSVSVQEDTLFQAKSDSLIASTDQSSEPTQVSTKIMLKGQRRVIDVPLREGNKLTLGTTDDCSQHIESLNGVQFKLEVRYRNRFVYLKDCGVGMGVFLKKRKVVAHIGAEVLLNVSDKWIVLKASPAKQLSVCIYSGDKCDLMSLDLLIQQQVDLEECSLIFGRRDQARQLIVRRSDRGDMWMLLGQESKVRAKDVLRVGPELLEVASISTYLECSAIIKRY